MSTAQHILVTVGMKCPRPLFEVHRTMRGIDAGAVLEVSADDPAFRLDIQAWCRRTGHELLALDQHDDRMVAKIRKAA
jgi:TusA-related sulfurtransferase